MKGQTGKSKKQNCQSKSKTIIIMQETYQLNGFVIKKGEEWFVNECSLTWKIVNRWCPSHDWPSTAGRVCHVWEWSSHLLGAEKQGTKSQWASCDRWEVKHSAKSRKKEQCGKPSKLIVASPKCFVGDSHFVGPILTSGPNQRHQTGGLHDFSSILTCWESNSINLKFAWDRF